MKNHKTKSLVSEANIQIATNSGKAIALNETVVQPFKDHLRGEMILPGDESYMDSLSTR